MYLAGNGKRGFYVLLDKIPSKFDGVGDWEM